MLLLLSDAIGAFDRSISVGYGWLGDANVNGAFEGDFIRPLGLVTMNFGLAEYELDSFIERLAAVGLIPMLWTRRSLGQKIGLLTDAIGTLGQSVRPPLDALQMEARHLLNRRNVLIHGCLLSGGRIVSGRSGVEEKRTSVDDLNLLANAIFNWKERLCVYRWKQIEPLIKALPSISPPNIIQDGRDSA